MSTRLLRVRSAFVLVSAVVVGVAVIVGGNAGPGHRAASSTTRHLAHVCGRPAPGQVTCLADVLVQGHTPNGVPDMSSSTPGGMSPAQILSDYGFPTSLQAGAGQTVAVVDAYDDPSIQADLQTFSTQYGLPACTTANGCLTKVNERGGSTFPPASSGWALEISLDVQWVHAVAPGARILLVEASTAGLTDLLTAEDYASAHAAYVSNSWGGPEFNGETAFDSHFTKPGVSYFVAAGDDGLDPEYPSESPNVISVGGTTLWSTSTGGFERETAWSDGGGGCSAYEKASAVQLAFAQYGQSGCDGQRATPDVSLDADPASGVSVYDSTPYAGQSGWFVVGGTSAASPMWAARSADTGLPVNAATVYGTTIPFRDITVGNNGAPAKVGYDLATGRGSWGPSASTPPGAPTGLSASPSHTGVSLQWSAPTSTGGSPVTSYRVYRGTQSGSEALLASGVTTPAYTDTTAPVGKPSFYRVAAANGVGVGPMSAEVSATVWALPTASFTKVCTSVTCTFTSTSTDTTGTIVQSQWGGNASGTASLAKTTFVGPGTYTITLTVVDDHGLTSASTGKVTCSENSSKRLVCS